MVTFLTSSWKRTRSKNYCEEQGDIPAPRGSYKVGEDMKILAFDQATQKTGYAVFDDTDLYKHGLIDLSKEKDTWERMQMMRSRIDDIIKRTKPSVVIIEGVAMQRNPQVLIELGRLQGFVMSSAFSRDIPVTIYLPTTWRKAVGIKQGGGIKREQLKAQAVDLVQEAYGITAQEDEVEAIAIGMAYLINSGAIDKSVK